MIMDVFCAQMTTPVTDKLKESHTKYVRVSANMINLFQPVDLTVNRTVKILIKRKLTEWHSLQVTKQLDSGKSCGEIEVKLLLSTFKPLHTSWVFELHNYLTSTWGKKLLPMAGRQQKLVMQQKKGSYSLETLNPSSIDPLD